MQGEPRGVRRGRCAASGRRRARRDRSGGGPRRGQHVHRHGRGREEDPQGRAARPARERACPRGGHGLRRSPRRRRLRGLGRPCARGSQGGPGAGLGGASRGRRRRARGCGRVVFGRTHACARCRRPAFHAAGRVRARRVACGGSTADGGGLSHARGREGAGRVRQRLHVLHRPRGARARGQPSGRPGGRRVRGLRARRGARDRACGHQPGVVLRGRAPRPWRPAPARPPGTPARRDGRPAWPGRATVPLPHIQHRAARRGRGARGRPGRGGRARVPPDAPAAAGGKRRRAARHGAALPLRRLRGAGGPPARGLPFAVAFHRRHRRLSRRDRRPVRRNARRGAPLRVRQDPRLSLFEACRHAGRRAFGPGSRRGEGRPRRHAARAFRRAARRRLRPPCGHHRSSRWWRKAAWP